MKFEVDEKDGVVIITPDGKIYDDPDLDKLRSEMRKTVRIGARRMVVDLGNVPETLTRGLSTFTEIAMALRKVNGDLKLARMSKQIKSIIAITRLSQFFDCYESVEEAVRSFDNQ